MDLRPLFQPTSVAIVGASANSGGARTMVHNLRLHGYQGPIYPVHPKNQEFEGLPCYPSLSGLPGRPDAVAINISADRSLEALAEAGRAGVRAAVVYGVGFAESGVEGARRQEQLVNIAREHNLAVVGPNCMGVIAPAYGSSLWTGALHPLRRIAGNVGLISHSGSVAIAYLSNDRFGLSLVASSGNEAVVNAADLLEFFSEDPKTEIIALFIETIRDRDRFAAAAIRAHRAGKPVIALKVGKSEAAARNVASHSGALAGSHRAASALFRSLAICEVESMEEMTEAIVAFQCRQRPAGEGVGVTHCSGGEASLLLDLAAPFGLTFPALSAETRQRVLPVWGEIAGNGNPLDTWGSMPYTQSYPLCLDALADQPDIDLLVLDQDSPQEPPAGLPDAPYRTPMNIAAFAAATARRSGKPVFFVSNLAGGVNGEVQETLQPAGVPLMLGLQNSLKGIAHWLRFHRWQRDGAPAARQITHLPSFDEEQLHLLGQSGSLSEVQSKRLLSAVGLRTPVERLAFDPDGAAEAAAQIGFPVAVKVVGRKLTHKTEVGGVHLGLRTGDDVRRTCLELQHRLGPRGLEGFLVAQMVPPGREFILGLSRDPQYGMTILCGAGGIMAEVFDDVAVRALPVDNAEAEAMISGLKAARMLGPWRGLRTADRAALRDAIVALGRFAAAAGDRIQEVDINPLVVHPEGEGATALDALVVLDP